MSGSDYDQSQILDYDFS